MSNIHKFIFKNNISGDGNCPIYATIDQMKYDPIHKRIIDERF